MNYSLCQAKELSLSRETIWGVSYFLRFFCTLRQILAAPTMLVGFQCSSSLEIQEKEEKTGY